MSEVIGFAISFGVFFSEAFAIVGWVRNVRGRQTEDETPAGDA